MQTKQIVKHLIDYPAITICDSNKLHDAQDYLNVHGTDNAAMIANIDYFELQNCSKTLACLNKSDVLYQASFVTADYKI